jgi:hypothetical protein
MLQVWKGWTTLHCDCWLVSFLLLIATRKASPQENEMTDDEYQLLVNSVCDIDKWSKQGTISEEVRDKFQMVCSAFYWLANEREGTLK